jgi:hypothetical protein
VNEDKDINLIAVKSLIEYRCGWGCDVSNWLSRRFNGFGSGGDYRSWRIKEND